MFNFHIRAATDEEKAAIKFRKEHEGAGNRKRGEEARIRQGRLDKILDMLNTSDVVAMEFNGDQARGQAYDEQTKLVNLALRSRSVTLRTKIKDGQTGTTLYLKREKSGR